MRRPSIGGILLGGGYALVAVGTAVHLSASRQDLSDGLAVVMAFAWLLAAMTWHVRSHDLGSLPAKVGLAVAAPLALVPVFALGVARPSAQPRGSATGTTGAGDVAAMLGSDVIVGAVLIVSTVALALVSLELMHRMPPPSVGRRVASLAILATFATAALLAWAANFYTSPWQATESLSPTVLWWFLTTVGVWLAASAALAAIRNHDGQHRHRRIASVLGYLGIGLGLSAASLALVWQWWPLVVLPALAVALSLILVGRFAVGPLEVEAEAAARERDLVVSSVEAERRRIVGEIHDGPITDLTLVVQRLDDAGDAEGAEIVRSVAADLRSVSNQLRVPILEDLGAGPAIEWLSEQMAERTQTPIEATVDDGAGRPPARVETAFYRIAQEAIVNAVKHGRGPVQVFYMAKPDRAELTVIDTGPGIDQAARTEAVDSGHIGLALMAQRARTVGAELRISNTEPVGTCVELEWGPTR